MLLAVVVLAAALNHPMLVSTDWLAAHLEDPLIVVVEVGSRSDFDSAHLPGARFVATDEIVADCEGIPNEIAPDETVAAAFTRAGVGDAKRIVLYSRNPLLAARAWFTLDYFGHGPRASLLDGGLEKWTLESRPTTTVSFTPKPAAFTIDVRPYSVIRFDEMTDLVRRRGKLSQKLVTVDARQAAFFRGDEPGNAVKRAGHIPDAVSVPWTANLASEHPPVLRDAEQLRKIYAAAGIDREAIVIPYCRTGMEASLTYFVLRYLGYDASLYDGSFVEWSASPQTIVVNDGVVPHRKR